MGKQRKNGGRGSVAFVTIQISISCQTTKTEKQKADAEF